MPSPNCHPRRRRKFPKFCWFRIMSTWRLDGDIFNPHLLAEDRQAIMDVQNALRAWNHEVVTLKRQDIELVFIVRKRRTVDVQGSVTPASRATEEVLHILSVTMMLQPLALKSGLPTISFTSTSSTPMAHCKGLCGSIT